MAANDETRNGHDGTYTGSYTLNQSPLITEGEAVLFTASGGTNVEIPDDPAISCSVALMLEIWFKYKGMLNDHTRGLALGGPRNSGHSAASMWLGLSGTRGHWGTPWRYEAGSTDSIVIPPLAILHRNG